MSDNLKTVDEWGQHHNIRILLEKDQDPDSKPEDQKPIPKRLWNKQVTFQEFSDLTDKYGFGERIDQ